MTMRQYNAYRDAQENHYGANQIPALYEGCIKFMYQAKDAIERKDYESRFNNVSKVCGIITGLRECLNFDDAPEVAKTLDDYYAMIDFQLLTLQSNDSAELCDQIIASIKQMHGAWKDVAAEYNRSQDVSSDESLSLSERAGELMSSNADTAAQVSQQSMLQMQEVDENSVGQATKSASYSAYEQGKAETLSNVDSNSSNESDVSFQKSENSAVDYDLRDLNI